MVRCSLYCSNCRHGNRKKITAASHQSWRCSAIVWAVCTTYRHILRPAQTSEEEQEEKTNINLVPNESMLLRIKLIQVYTQTRHRCDSVRGVSVWAPEQLQQHPLLSGFSQIVDEVSQSRLSGLQLPKQNLWTQKHSWSSNTERTDTGLGSADSPLLRVLFK